MKNKKPTPVEFDVCRVNIKFFPADDAVVVEKIYSVQCGPSEEEVHFEHHHFDLRTMTLQNAIQHATLIAQNMYLVKFEDDEQA